MDEGAHQGPPGPVRGAGEDRPFRLIDHLDPENLRVLNHYFFETDDEDYLKSGPFGTDSHRRTEQRIRNVSGTKLKKLVQALPDFLAADVRQAWSHWMALACGRHFWPDANHRTAFYSFSAACNAAMDKRVSLDAAKMTAMGEESKAMRDPHKRKTGRYYSVHELADPDHPYRRLFTHYEKHLEFETAPDTTGPH